MPQLVFAYAAFAILAALLNLRAVDRLRQEHANPELNSWLYFLVIFHTVNFLNWIGAKKIVPLLFTNVSGMLADKIRLGYTLFALPLILIGFFFYLTLLARLSGRKLPAWGATLLAAAMALLGTAIFWLYLTDFPGGDLSRIKALWRHFNLIGSGYYMLLPLPFLAVTFFNQDEFERRRNRAVLLAFMAVMILTYLTPLDWLQPTIGAGLKLDLLAPLMFLLPLLPLRVERHYLELGLRLRPPPQAALDLQPLCDEFGISAREREILEMVVAGRSRRDIEAALFISGSTIKSHLYSSYRKLDVKNRVQLLNLLQHAQHRAGPDGRHVNPRR